MELDNAKQATPPPSPGELAVLEAAVRDAQGALAVAQAELTAANAALAALEAPVPGAATAELQRAVTVADIEVRTASQAVSLAERQVSVLSTRDGSTGAALWGVNERLGVQVPADELLFFPTLPRRIDEVTVKVGDEITGPVMTVSNLQLAVDGAVSANDAELIRVGAPATIVQPELAITTTGQVTQIADTPGTNGVDPQRFYLEVTPNRRARRARGDVGGVDDHGGQHRQRGAGRSGRRLVGRRRRQLAVRGPGAGRVDPLRHRHSRLGRQRVGRRRPLRCPRSRATW